MTPDPIRFPAAERTTEETVTWRALQGALVGPLSEHLTHQALVLTDLAEKVAAVDATRTRDRQEMARVQEGLRASIDATRGKLDTTEGLMATGFADIRKDMKAGMEAREEWHKEVMTAVGKVLDWQGRHESWHDGVKDGKHDTGQTLAIAAAVQAAPTDHRTTDDGDEATRALISAARRIPWGQIARWAAGGGGLLGLWELLKAWLASVAMVAVFVLAAGSQGCAHLSPAEERLEAVGTSAAERCLAPALLRCMWGAGAQGYWKCLLNESLPCAVEHAADAVEAGGGLLMDHYGMRLAGVDPGEAARRRGEEVLLCFEAVDVPYVVEHCPDGKAPRLCLVDAATFCLDGESELTAP